MIEDVEDRIRERAHRIWEREGKPADRADAHWFLAARELFPEKAPKSSASPRGSRKTAPAGVDATPAPKARAGKTKMGN